jgi:hypothetical protein
MEGCLEPGWDHVQPAKTSAHSLVIERAKNQNTLLAINNIIRLVMTILWGLIQT